MQNDVLSTILNQHDIQVDGSPEKVSAYFEELVFTKSKMKEYLSKDVYSEVIECIELGHKINRDIAGHVASAMRSWAMSHGAKSYTHWFQPLTGATAEKHDSFFTPKSDGQHIEQFTGDALVQQEPDASSFPNGGIRATFEARGYTAWDPSSPAFILELKAGKVLCIPTIFISYTGEALDYKAPLLKSIHFLEKHALPIARMFDRHANRVQPTLGWEQEYFLVDERMYYARPDLVMAGRTLIGSAPAKGQQLDDHYFGSIPERVYSFMVDLEYQAHRLGIPIQTRHNEVAPGQYEFAPMYESVNVAVDHNQLVMDLMDRVASRHKLKVLKHEKPFAGINGSGKHNNWSLGTDTGKNLLSPGSTPKTNLRFLTFFVNVIKAVHEHADVLRASIASAGNDHRLGANEAPPAIISVFIGSHLTGVLDSIQERVEKGKKFDEESNANLKLDIHKMIPDVLLDNTDRNRTSPFAFTGNKFEIRAVGSSTNCASPMIVMNTIVGAQLEAFKKDVDALIAKDEKRDGAILRVLSRYIEESKAIRFEGDNYTEEWAKEAAKRKLSNVKDSAHALGLFETDKAIKLFTSSGVFNEVELEARQEINYENYNLKLHIEVNVLADMARTMVVPAAIRYQKKIADTLESLEKNGVKSTSYMRKELALIGEHIEGLLELTGQLDEVSAKASSKGHARDEARYIAKNIIPYFEKVRGHCDALEARISDAEWPLPKYRDMLFIR